MSALDTYVAVHKGNSMLTEKRDLRGGKSLWQDYPGGAIRPRTTLSRVTCDVAVVGAGVSGALVALALTNAGHDVVIVDRRSPGSGSTAASTAMIQFELDVPLRELSDKIGASKARRAYRRSLQAVADLSDLISKNKLACDWRDREAVYLAGNELGPVALRREAAARKSAGLPSSYITAQNLFDATGIERGGAIISQGAGELNPAKLTAAALLSAKKRGCRIYSGHTISRVEGAGKGVVLATSDGDEIQCSKAIFTTGYETVEGMPKAKFDITSSWAIATRPVDAKQLWPGRSLIWEASDPYLYVRTTPDNRVIAGGEDSSLKNPNRRDRAITAKSEKLLNALNQLLPGRGFELDYAWAGAFAVSPSGLPIICTIEGQPNCMAVLGCGGNGITFSMIASQIVESWVNGARDPDAALFEEAGK